MIIEKKIVISGCGNCPFSDYDVGTFYGKPRYVCKKYGFTLDYHIAHSDEKTHPHCMLPINIDSNNIIDGFESN